MNLLLNDYNFLLPIIQVALIVILKLVAGQDFKFENFKRVLLESSQDLEITLFSFIILNYINTINGKLKTVNTDFMNSIVSKLLVCIIILIVIYAITNSCINNYNSTGKSRYIIIGSFINYTIVIAHMYYIINFIILP